MDWGDGTTSAATVALVGGNTFEVVGDHVYAAPGGYPVTVTVQDVGGAPPLVINSVTFSVASAPPAAPSTKPANNPPPASGAPAPARASVSPPQSGSNDGLVLVTLVPSSSSGGGEQQNEPKADAGFAALAILALTRPGTSGGLGLSGGGGDQDAAPPQVAAAQGNSAILDTRNADAAPPRPGPGNAPATVQASPLAPDTSPKPVTAILPDKPAAPPAPPVAHLHTNFLWQSLDKVGDELAGQPTERKGASVALTSVAMATAGYVLLTGRTGSWLLSVLTSQPLWKEYDPLAVLLAREKERKRARGPRQDEDKETLQSLVG